jgi:hypothetical protein
MKHTALVLSVRYKFILNILGVLLGIVLFAYLFLAFNTTYLIASKNLFDTRASFLRSDLGEIESQYINTTSAITIDLAYKMGFYDNVKDTVYITRIDTATAFLDQ